MKIIAYILSSILFIIWLYLLRAGRKISRIAIQCNTNYQVMNNTIFQLHILPLYTSIFLLITKQPLIITIALLLFFLSRGFPVICNISSLIMNFFLAKLIFNYFWNSFFLDWLLMGVLTVVLDYVVISTTMLYVKGHRINSKRCSDEQ